jgi:hypothetical protein
MSVLVLAYDAMDVLGGLPESAMWALMLGGMALVSLTIRRRNRSEIVYA